MKFPDSLPAMLEYRVGTTVRTALCRRPVKYVGSSGATDAAIIFPTIPHGCTGWRRVLETDWLPLADIPKAWLPFLNRARETELDPRPDPDKAAETQKRLKQYRTERKATNG